jgi:hypothetical protein
MATQEQRLKDVVSSLGGDYKKTVTTMGPLDQLSTSTKSSLVNAINELYGNISGVDFLAAYNTAKSA